jgi:hypothetical protein
LRKFLLGLSIALSCSRSLDAQQTATSDQLWPQADVYLSTSRYTRLDLEGQQRLAEGESVIENNIAGYFDTAPLYVLSNILRSNNDVFRQKYVVLRLGYYYSTSFAETVKSSHENRIVGAVTLRLPLTRRLLFTQRNQGDFRFFKGGFAPRYRAKFELDWDIHLGRLPFTPYFSAEYFWDSRFDAWDRSEYTLGFQVPMLKIMRFSSYYMYQSNTRTDPARVNVAGVNLSFFF